MKISIIGAGNIGRALAKGLTDIYAIKDITVTRRDERYLKPFEESGFVTTTDNIKAVKATDIVFVTVLPQQVNDVLSEVGPALKDNALVISCVTGISIAHIRKYTGNEIKIARAMPNTAIAIRESMTCISFDGLQKEEQETVIDIFNQMGSSHVIEEEMMTAATALCSCGMAFILKAVRAASQAGIEMGFHSDEALKLTTQTAKGASALLDANKAHPETEIDKVTSPKGCTIAGLNEMEHRGFSSAMIRGMLTSFTKAKSLYND